MDPVALEQAFTLYPEVKLVVMAHLYGFPAKVDEIKRICEAHGALLIEDAAEAMGATVNGKHELKNLVIDPEAVDPEDVEMLQDMIVAAVNEAMRAADADAAGTMSKLTGGLGLPF